MPEKGDFASIPRCFKDNSAVDMHNALIQLKFLDWWHRVPVHERQPYMCTPYNTKFIIYLSKLPHGPLDM